MSSPKLTTMLSLISGKFSKKNIPFCLIGALALGIYGLPRYTADIDLMADADFWPDISSILDDAGYTCFQKSNAFAQFDSELNIFGKVDIMLATTDDGKEIIKRSIAIEDDLMGNIPVIQPSDYIILKLMAIANNPDRTHRDEADISEFLKMYSKSPPENIFDDLDIERIKYFASRFNQLNRIETLLSEDITLENNKKTFTL